MINKKIFSPIQEIVRDAKKGKMFILVDDGDRENEGDLVIPGSKCNSKNINFMAKHGRGLICLALTSKKVKKLNLPLMSSINKSRTQTAFTISIESKTGVTTGISAQDRAKTIKNQAKVIKDMWSELQTLKRILIDEHPDTWIEIQYKTKYNDNTRKN